MRKTVISAAAVAAAAITFGIAGSAHAELYGIDDPEDTYHGSDLRAVQIRNGEHRLVVTTHHDNLVRSWRSGSAGAVYIDTDARDKGPEYVFAGGYFEGTDYQLLHTEGFGPQRWGRPVDGSYRMRVDYADDTVRMTMSRKAVGSAGKVRIAVRVSGTRTDGTSHGLVDWLGQPRSFTPWIAKG
jgi:hypothetical protein